MSTVAKIARNSTSKSFQKLNPGLFANQSCESDCIEIRVPSAKKKRVRQDSKPLMNKLETEWHGIISNRCGYMVHVQSFKLRLANGVNYTPDFVAFTVSRQVVAWEVKGPKAWAENMVRLKIAAKEYPWIRFVLVWKEGGQWVEQEILP